MPEELHPHTPLLLVDDEPAFLRSLSMTLRRSGGYTHLLTCADSRQVMELLTRQKVSAILLDLTMPHLTGEELLPQILGEHPQVPVIVLSGLNQVDTAVRCMKAGAFDYFVKTTEADRLLAGIGRALAHAEKQQQYENLKERFFREKLERPEAFAALVTRSRKMQTVFHYIEAIAASAEPVLIVGESGVGKELVARAVHRTSRPEAPWVAVNVAGLDDSVFADTLFGHLKGAFTGAERPRPGMIEKAGSGVLFLDEIGDLSAASQVKLLRLLQEGEYFPLGGDSPQRSRARIVCATNVELGEKMNAGSFRKDLYYRLMAHRIVIPPLRERPEDIPLLLRHFLQEAAQACGKRVPEPDDEILTLLAGGSFPGNVRELRALVFDAVSVHQGGRLNLQVFRQHVGNNGGPAASPLAASSRDFAFPERLPTLVEIGELLLAEALRRHGGNQTRAAKALGITRQGVAKRMKKTAD